MFGFALPAGLNPILEAIRGAGGRPLIVGGAVRDAALGRRPKDFDIEVYGLGLTALAEALGRVGRVHQVGRSFGVLKVSGADLEVDVALPRRESKAGRGHRGFIVEPDAAMTPREAASRRDFTINAMAYDPVGGDLLDFFGGQEDLEQRRLRHTGPAFAEDPLRVLRGMQFAGRFDLTVDPATVDLSRRLLPEYDTLAIERVWTEWHKWASRSTRPSRGLSYLRASGWWSVYPALEALADCPQDPEWHPEGDVWVHTLLVTDAAAELAERDRLGEEDRTALVLAGLCHDLGKPETTVRVDGRIRSPNHAVCLATVEDFLTRIGCPRSLGARVGALTRHHLAHMGFVGSARHVRRLARALGEEGETIEMLGRLIEADHGARPPLAGGLPDAMARMLAVARELATAAAAPRPLLQGRHLLELGVVAGPTMGRLLREAYEAQLDGVFDDLQGARDWARTRAES